MKTPVYLLFVIATLLITACAPTVRPTEEVAAPSVSTEANTEVAPQPTTPLVSTPEPAMSLPASEGATLFGVFEGITPCSAQARPLPQIPEDSNCEEMIWIVTLHQDAATGAPTTYELHSTYGLPKNNTLDVADGSPEVSMEGTWEIVRGIKINPEAEVYQLNLNETQTLVSFLKINDDLLHVLGSDRALLVGHGAWSYTLNRTDNPDPSLTPPVLGTQPDPAPRPPKPGVPAGSEIYEVFEGRTPCDAWVLTFSQTEAFDTCAKIKWQLTLYRSQQTTEPSTYLYMSTSGYRQGTWEVVEGLGQDPSAVVYQLVMDEQAQPMSFLKMDANHLYILDADLNLLLGNGQFSYTLSRTNVDSS